MRSSLRGVGLAFECETTNVCSLYVLLIRININASRLLSFLRRRGESLPLTPDRRSVRTPSAGAGRPRDAPEIVRGC